MNIRYLTIKKLLVIRSSIEAPSRKQREASITYISPYSALSINGMLRKGLTLRLFAFLP